MRLRLNKKKRKEVSLQILNNLKIFNRCNPSQCDEKLCYSRLDKIHINLQQEVTNSQTGLKNKECQNYF